MLKSMQNNLIIDRVKGLQDLKNRLEKGGCTQKRGNLSESF